MTHSRTTSPDELQGWFAGRLPADWFAGAPTVETDRDEILVVGTLAEPELPTDASADAIAAARASRIAGYREDTREIGAGSVGDQHAGAALLGPGRIR